MTRLTKPVTRLVRFCDLMTYGPGDTLPDVNLDPPDTVPMCGWCEEPVEDCTCRCDICQEAPADCDGHPDIETLLEGF